MNISGFKEKYGPYALITGASSGIGVEFANQLAQHGLNLVLVARRKDKLIELAGKLIREHKIMVKCVEADLLQPSFMDVIVQETAALQIGLVVLSAGLESHGLFIQRNVKAEADLVQVNVMAPMQMSHYFANNMTQQKRGGIIFVSSMMGHQAVPFFANYGASKAYILSMGNALHYELKKSGVDVLVLSPGPVKTAMQEDMIKKGMDFTKLPTLNLEVEPVVRSALRGLGNKMTVIPGTRNAFMDAMGKYTTPRRLLTGMFGMLVKRAMDKKLTVA